MPEGAWLGAIYLLEEGYSIILRSLVHYRRRLGTLHDSPELRDAAAMFATVLNQQAAKTIPQIDRVERLVKDGLADPSRLGGVREEVPFLQKALDCYAADIRKAQDTGHRYFVDLVGGSARSDATEVELARGRIGEFSQITGP